MKDTDPEVDAIYEQMLLSRSGAERLLMASSMHAAAKALVLASLRERHADASEEELRGLLFLRFYADDFSPEDRAKIHQHLVGGA